MTRRTDALACLVTFYLAVAAAQQCRNACTNKDGRSNFDYFYLVRQWPATYCSVGFCSRPPAKNSPFTLHGLWPQRRAGGWPSCCPGAPLNANDLQPLKADLATNWPSYNQPDTCFYKHEWDKHGTCALGSSKDIQTAKDYFAATLRVHKQLDISKALASSGITPSDTKTYSADSIRQALKRAWGAWVNLSCDKEGRLTEIMTCLDKQLGVIDCPLGRPYRTPDGRFVNANSQCGSVSLPVTSKRSRTTG